MQKVHVDKEANLQTVWWYSLEILLFFYSGKAPTRLFVAHVVTVQPFDDAVASL